MIQVTKRKLRNVTFFWTTGRTNVSRSFGPARETRKIKINRKKKKKERKGENAFGARTTLFDGRTSRARFRLPGTADYCPRERRASVRRFPARGVSDSGARSKRVVGSRSVHTPRKRLMPCHGSVRRPAL